ncbi:MAG: cupin domain-containing protein, partial [Burkholderiales bacterium]
AGPADREAIEIFFAQLSPASRYLHFLHLLRQLPQALMTSLLRFEPPGKRAFPFHSDHANEEMFFILEGGGTLRYGHEEQRLRKGDVV